MFDDIIGAEDIIGADLAIGDGGFSDLDTLFAGSGPMIVTGAEAQALGVNRAQLMSELAGRNSAAVVRRQPTKAREYPLGFPTTTVANGASASISAQPQVPFRGRRLIVPSDIAGSFLIDDLKIGKNSMFPSSNPVPARCFTELGVGVDLNLDTAQISQLVVLSVSNTSGAPADFNAAIIGTAVE